MKVLSFKLTIIPIRNIEKYRFCIKRSSIPYKKLFLQSICLFFTNNYILLCTDNKQAKHYYEETQIFICTNYFY